MKHVSHQNTIAVKKAEGWRAEEGRPQKVASGPVLTTVLSVQMTAELRQRIRVEAAKNGMQSSPFCVLVLEKWLASKQEAIRPAIAPHGSS